MNTDILLLIIKQLHFIDVLQFRLISKYFYNIVNYSKLLNKYKYHKRLYFYKPLSFIVNYKMYPLLNCLNDKDYYSFKRILFRNKNKKIYWNLLYRVVAINNDIDGFLFLKQLYFNKQQLHICEYYANINNNLEFTKLIQKK